MLRHMHARYVVLIHDDPRLHWDFMLEAAGALRTWRLEAEPDVGGEISARPLPDHRLAYLEYEGPVSGDRGEVRRWDRGEYELLEEQPRRLAVRLAGEKLRGTAVLEAADRSQGSGTRGQGSGVGGQSEDRGSRSENRDPSSLILHPSSGLTQAGSHSPLTTDRSPSWTFRYSPE